MEKPIDSRQRETLPLLPEIQRLSQEEAFSLALADLKLIGEFPLNNVTLLDGQIVDLPMGQLIETEMGTSEMFLRPDLVKVLLVTLLIWISWLRTLTLEALLNEIDKIALGRLPGHLSRIIRLIIGNALKNCPVLTAVRRKDSALAILDDWRGNLDLIRTIAGYKLVAHGETYELVSIKKDGGDSIEALAFPGRVLGAVTEQILAAAAVIAEAPLDVLATQLGIEYFSGEYPRDLSDTLLTAIVTSLNDSGGVNHRKLAAIDALPSYQRVTEMAYQKVLKQLDATGEPEE